MAENTAQARKQLDGHRAAVRDHARKHRDYRESYEKDFAWKTIQNVQSHITKLKSEHPSLSQNSTEDTWRPGNSVPW